MTDKDGESDNKVTKDENIFRKKRPETLLDKFCETFMGSFLIITYFLFFYFLFFILIQL